MPEANEIKNWRQLVPAAFGLLTPIEKKRALGITALLMLTHLLDSIALVGVMPLVGVVVEPELLNSHEGIAWLHQAMGKPTTAKFINWLAVGALLLIVLGKVGQFLMQDQVRRFCVSCQNRMSREMMEKILAAPYEWHLNKNAAVSAHHVSTDILMWANCALLRSLYAAGYISLLVCSMGVLIYCAPWAGVLGLIGVAGIAAFLLKRINTPLLRLHEERREGGAQYTASAQQIFAGIKDIKLSGQEGWFLDNYVRRLKAYGQSGVMLHFIQAVPPVLLVLFGQIALILIVLMLWHAGGSSGEISAQMALIVLVTSRVIPGANRFISEASKLQEAVPGVRAILKFGGKKWAHQDCEENNSATTKPPANDWQQIQMEEVSFRYPETDNYALQKVSMKISRGSFLGIAGASGSGKSTAMDILVGLLSPTEGFILEDKEGRVNLQQSQWRSNIGFVPQEPFIADSTLRANVAFGEPEEDVNDCRVRECLELANLSEFLSSLEHGLDSRLGERGECISGGQKQRVAIARALYQEPIMLVLDEATSALDSRNERDIQKALEKLHGKLTVVVIAHRLTTLKKCDTIYLFDDGRIVGQGTYSQLSDSSILFQSLAGNPV